MALTNAAFQVHEAAKLQGPLQTSKAVLYTHTLCPYAQRVFLTMLLKVRDSGACYDLLPSLLLPAWTHARWLCLSMLELPQLNWPSESPLGSV